jgi:ribosomal protein S10
MVSCFSDTHSSASFLEIETNPPQQRIHKRLIDLNAPTEIVKQIIVNIEAGVEVEVTIAA